MYLLLRTFSLDCVIHRGVSNLDVSKFCGTSCAPRQMVPWLVIADQQPRDENQPIIVTLNADEEHMSSTKLRQCSFSTQNGEVALAGNWL
jgi:hypothetical protein